MTGLPAYDAVVLAGGAARRMGTDKTRLRVGGLPILDRVLTALAGAEHVVVVGAKRPTTRPVRWTLEQPPGGGPAAGLAAGLALVEAAYVAVLAADLPLLTAEVVRLLRERALGAPGAVLTDPAGAPQWACGVWRTGVLRGAGGLEPDAALRRALGPLGPVLVPAPGGAWLDCDTPEDLDRARGLA